MARPKPATHGETMIKLTLYFWTNNLAGPEGHVLPGEAWDSGAVSVQKNALHELTGVSTSGNTFHGLHDVGRAVERALSRAGVKLHHGRRARKLYVLHDRQAIAEAKEEQGDA